MRYRAAVLAAALAAFLAGTVAPSSAATPGQKCASTKRKEAGKKANRKLKCWSKGIKAGGSADGFCLGKAETIFSSKWDKAEAKGGCATLNDKMTIEDKVDAFVDDVVDELTGSPAGSILGTQAARDCASSKLKATGKKAAAFTKCYAKAASKGLPAVDGFCLSKATGKFSAKWDKAEAKGGCATTNDKATIEGKVDAFAEDVADELPTGGSTTTTTTSSTSTTTGTTLPPNTCCPAGQIVTESTGHCSTTTSQSCFDDSGCPGGQTCVSDGILQVGTFPNFAFPLGVVTTLDVGPATYPACQHNVIIPAGGFIVPTFCSVAALQLTTNVTYTGCEVGSGWGKGRLWDGVAACHDASISKKGDTKDGVCDASVGACNTLPGGAGANTLGDVDTTRGPTVCDGPAVNLQLDLPAIATTWQDGDLSIDCPDEDGVYNPGQDTFISEFTFILSPTTASATAEFVDKNADSCSFAGSGPAKNRSCSNDSTRPCSANTDCPGGTCVVAPLQGIAAPGPCCAVGQPAKVAANGTAFSGGSPLFDLIYQSAIPTRITTCGAWPGPDSCILTTDPCLGSPSGAFLAATELFD